MSDPFCTECPDAEACAAGWPCDEVKRIDAELTARLAWEKANWPTPRGGWEALSPTQRDLWIAATGGGT